MKNNFFLGTIGTEETFGKTFLLIAMDKDQNSMASLFPVSLENLRDQVQVANLSIKTKLLNAMSRISRA